MFLDPLLDIFRGKAVTIPPMDGALRPNTRLDDAGLVATASAPDSLAHDGTSVIYAGGNALYRLGHTDPLKTYAAPITALAAKPDGTLGVGLDSGVVLLDGKEIPGFTCPTALAFAGDDLLVCNGSAAVKPSNWVTDLMQANSAGSVWRVNAATGARQKLADGLAFPFGIVSTGDAVVVSESWRHRLLRIPMTGGKPQPVLSRLPAYPGRLTPISDGYLLALFAPLNRLVEFVLQERDYRQDMMRDIDSAHWIAPSLSASQSFLEPLQNGGVRSMGVHKPWSPTRSYGLLVRLDSTFRPVESFHSRANGHRHGIMSAVEADGRILAASKGGNAILGLSATREEV